MSLSQIRNTDNSKTTILIRLMVGAVFFEIMCGILVLSGLLVRLASIPLIIIMLVAFTTTKSEILAKEGFWAMLHGSHTDWAMLLGSVFLLIKGAGYYSIDFKIMDSKNE